jgi:hypothetical protein
MRFYESTVGGKSILLPGSPFPEAESTVLLPGSPFPGVNSTDLLPGSPFPEDAGGEVKKTVTRPKKITVINKPNR